MDSMYQKALIFATKKHLGQKRRNGNNYIIHPIRVSQDVMTQYEKVIALLHDTVEDTDTTLIEIKQEFDDVVMYNVGLLTHFDGVAYEDYIDTILVSPYAVNVKIADIVDNLSDNPSNGYIKKASKALEKLVLAF